MSNDIATQQLSIPSSQMGQLEPKLDSSMQMGLMGLGTNPLQHMSMSDTGIELVGSCYNDTASQQMSMSNLGVGSVGPGYNGSASQQMSTSNLGVGSVGPGYNSSASQQMSTSNLGVGSVGPGYNGSASQQMSTSNLGVGSVGPGYNSYASQQMSMSNMQMGMLQPTSNNLGSQVLLSNQQHGQMDRQTYNMVSHQFFLPSRQRGEHGTISNNVTSQQLSLLNKRKTPMEPFMMQMSSISNKRVAQLEHRPLLQPVTAPDKRFVQQMQFMPNSPGSQHSPASNKKVVQKESALSKSGPQKQSMPKGQNVQSSAKVQTGSSESLRSKMRENLAAALALVSQDKSSNAEKSSQNEAATIPGKTQEISQPDVSIPIASDAVKPVSVEPKEAVTLKEGSSAMSTDVQRATRENFANGNTSADMQTPKYNGQDFQYSNHLPDEDVTFSDNFFARDELLQGNGLSWVLEPVTGVEEKNVISTAENHELKNQKVVDGGRGEPPPDQSPQMLASKIEAELFKLFGGVNKKYKEKGRSLLFNLKDHNNPELRERVMSGEIPPARLCSMTAEELASKELSEWRIAKAEEMAQMVVLPDSEVDIRRLVKKTHKGEFQVEVEQVDNTSVDVSVSTSSLDRRSEKENEAKASPASKAVRMKEESNVAAAGKRSNVEDQEDPCTITIPSIEGTDLMQGLMVDNEMKDAEFLPPIVSLDEFMESLNSEPPFEDIPGDAEKSTSKLDKDDTDVGSESKSLVQTSQDPVNATPAKHDNVELSESKSDTAPKSSDSPVKSETAAPVAALKGELVWEGLLQLNISAMASVIGIFKSGEKMSTKEWASFLEIKGRVKLDAFEKYLQQLPTSRSRAVMILHFVGKEASPKSDRKNLSEIAESYVSDGRVGIAEPGHGIELYFCPPHSKTFELLSKIVAKDQLEAISAIDNGLIGVLVWKKAHLTSTISPNSASHHKHASRKHFTSTSRRHQDKDTTATRNMNLVTTPKPSMYAKPQVQDDEDDDEVPPGFGPGAARDDDDLPEFNFSGGGSNQHTPRGAPAAPFHHPQTPSRPVDQIRELILKYGQPQSAASSDRSVGVATQPWNDDDDDIPEWQPQAPLLQPQQPVHGYQRAHMVSHQQHVGLMQPHQQYRQQAVPLQPQMNVMQAQQQNQWAHGTYMAPPSQPGAGGVQSNVQPGVAWRQDAPKSRGF